MKKILIVDDHPLFRESLIGILGKLNLQTQPPEILQAENAKAAIEIIRDNLDVDLILSDIDMPGMKGLELLQELKKILPNAAIVVISGSEKHSDVQHALSLGAKGFIQKNAETSVLLAALQLILAGGTYIPPLFLQAPQAPFIDPESPMILTERQREILVFLQQGQQNKIIAYELDLSEATVKVHVRHIFSVLGVKNRTQAVQKAQQLGLI